jgi:hypothetical protein
VRAAGGCSLRLAGRDYVGTDPELLSRLAAKPLLAAAFSPMERASFRMLGIRQFMSLRIQAVPDDPRPAAAANSH